MTAHAVMDSAEITRTYAMPADADLIAAGGSPCRAIRAAGAGDVTIVNTDGTVTTIPNIQVGETIRVRAVKILAAGTTAARLTVFW